MGSGHELATQGAEPKKQAKRLGWGRRDPPPKVSPQILILHSLITNTDAGVLIRLCKDVLV